MTSVLGTRIANGEPAPTALLVSDLHLPMQGGPVLDALRRVVAVARAERAALFVLGDLFDSYVSPAQVRHGACRDVAALFASSAADGVRTTVLVGNRDFLLGPEFTAASRASLLDGGLRAELGGVDTLLLHGDELCQNDVPYQRAKRWLRHPVTRRVARGLPLRVALLAAERARRKSRTVIARGDQSRFLPTAAAMAQAFASGVQRLAFGHVHRHAHGRFGGGEYRILPAFDASAGGVLVRQGEWRAVRFSGTGGVEPVDEPPPCPFA